jgi:superfamily II DNA or RNA helicase
MWFDPISLSELADAATFARGLTVFRAQKVLSMELQPLAADHWLVSGSVRGTQRVPYEVTVDVRLMPDGRELDRWLSHCSCPVEVQCKHAVALLLKAAYQAKPPQGPGSQPGEQPPSSLTSRAEASGHSHENLVRERALAEQRRVQYQQEQAALRWLRQESLHMTPGSAPRQQQPGTRSEYPLYLLQAQDSAQPRPGLRLFLGASSPKAKGGWSKPRPVGPRYFTAPSHSTLASQLVVSDLDREALELMAALPTSQPSTYYHSAGTDWPLDGVAAPMVLQRASATGRLFWRLEGGGLGQAIRWGGELALAWRWVSTPGPTPDELLWQLEPQLPSPDAVLFANQPTVFYVNLASGQCGLVSSHGTAGAADPSATSQAPHAAPIDGVYEGSQAPSGGSMAGLQHLLQAPPLPQTLMVQHQHELLAHLGEVAPVPPALPELLRVGGSPVWRLHLSRVVDDGNDSDSSGLGLLTAQLDFDYQGYQGWWPSDAGRSLVLEHHGQRVWLTRDLASEGEAVARLNGLGLTEWAEGMYALPPGASQLPWLQWADDGFQALSDVGFEVGMDAELRNWVRDGGDLVASVSPHRPSGAGAGVGTSADADATTSPWFDLSLGLEVNGERTNVLPWLPHIIRLVRNLGGSLSGAPDARPALPPHLYLPAHEGAGFVRVPTAPLEPWLHALLELFDDKGVDFAADSLRLSRMDALRARVALGEGVAWQGAQHLSQLAQQLQGHAGLPVTPQPAGLQADMRPYQHQGLDWLQFLRAHGLAGILADDMGLGKTLQTLAHIQCEKEAGRLDRPALVVAPVSLMGNWQREANRFCPGLNTLVLHGAERHERADDMARADLVIAPYSLMHRDRERWLAQPWHLVVLDEAQNIKNAATQSAQVVGELNTRHRLCLSGTPIENHLGEIWSLFHFLMPGFLGSQTKFQQRFRHPIEKHGDGQRLAQLRARLTPFILRRTKQLVAHELPPKVESVMSVELSGKQADLYETIRLSMEKAVRDAIADKGLAKSQIVFLDALLKLRQVCCDPRLVKTAAAAKVKTSAKLEQLMDMLPEMLAEGRRVLLFSQFTSMLSLIEGELKARHIPWAKLTGQTQKRDEVIERFTSGQVPLFLISLKAGGVGLNLPQADTVIHFDPWWNPAAENQATDRAHRMGQTQSVWVIKLVAQGTIEERILALQARKAELARELYSGATGRKQPLFTEDDVRELLQPLA